MSPEMTQETVILSGFPVLLDAEDLPLIASHNWDIRDNGRGQKYVSGSIAGKSEYLHRKIMGARKGQLVDHANGDTLDNRRANLRFATKSQNAANMRKPGRDLPKGVTASRGRYNAKIKVQYKIIGLGTHQTAEAAGQAYDRAAIKFFGEFACLNYPERRSTYEAEIAAGVKVVFARPADYGLRCKHGHEMTPENTGLHGKSRYCRICHRARYRAWRVKDGPHPRQIAASLSRRAGT